MYKIDSMYKIRLYPDSITMYTIRLLPSSKSIIMYILDFILSLSFTNVHSLHQHCIQLLSWYMLLHKWMIYKAASTTCVSRIVVSFFLSSISLSQKCLPFNHGGHSWFLNYTRPSPHPLPLHIHAPEIRLGLDVTYVFCIFELSTQIHALAISLGQKMTTNIK